MTVTQKYEHQVIPVGTVVQTILGDPLKITSVLHFGEFGDVYEAEEPVEKTRMCLRTEHINCPKAFRSLDCFIRLAQRYPLADRRYSRHLINVTKQTGDFGELNELRFHTCELLGPNLDDLRQLHLQRNFTHQMAFYMCDQILRALSELHRLGYVHRRVSPKSFCVGSHVHESLVFVVGYSHLHYVKKGNREHKVYKDDYKSSIRGSKVFQSVAAQREKTVYFRDDLESLLFTFIDVFKMGAVPWKSKEPAKMLDDKVKMRQGKFKNFDKLLPPDFEQLFRILRTFDETDRPECVLLHEIIDKCARRYEINIGAVAPDFLGKILPNFVLNRPPKEEVKKKELTEDPDSDRDEFEACVKARVENKMTTGDETKGDTSCSIGRFKGDEPPDEAAEKTAKRLKRGKKPKHNEDYRVGRDIFIV
ncbi:unnamed protein product, partial [Mesorhabditis spiculigera]